MKRSWQVWLLYAACLAIAVPALAWLTFAALAIERAENAARAGAKRDEDIRLASWRIDSLLMPIVAPEAARSYDDYLPLLRNRSAGAPPTSKYVLAYFELSQSGWTFSPTFSANRDAASAQREQLLCDSFGCAEVSARLPGEWLPPKFESDPQNLGLLDRAAKQSQTIAANQAPQQLDHEYLRRQSTNLKNTAREMVQQRATKAPLHPGIVEAVTGPLWAGGELLLAHRVKLGDGEIVQGCWLDWPHLRADMQAEVADLLPGVTLLPLAAGAEINYAHALATLPVQLAVPQASVEPLGWTPLRIGLLVAWIGLLAVAAAAAALLAGMISLGRRREAFVSAVTHELRTPLTTFRMYSEMLGSGMVTDENQRRDYLRTLKLEADRLWHLVENVLAYARLERAKPAHRVERLTFPELWKRVEPRLADRARQADMELVLDATASGQAASLVTDPAAVEQILFNLVDNACKYAARATPRTIQVRATTSNGHVELRVRDQGAGIAPADARRLFQPFSKSAERAATSAPGVGLGLALCRQLARQLRGDLRYEPGQGGTTFVLTLPRAS
jgi:signal transduction histidine kinase